MDEHTFDATAELEAVIDLTHAVTEAILRRLEAIGRADRSRRYLAHGYTSVVAFLVHRCGLGVGEANRQVFLARALAVCPHAAKLVEAGRLSLDQFQILAHAQSRHPVAYQEEEATLAEAVTDLTVRDTKHAVDYWSQAHTDPTDDHPEEPSRVFLANALGGRGRLDGDLSPEDHALLSEALDTLVSDLVHATAREDLAPMPELRAQALAEMARRHLDAPSTPTDHGNRPHLTVVVDWEVLSGARRDKTSELGDGTVITPSAAQRLACDASVCRLLTGPSGEILDLGRTRRTVSAAQWKALRLRDRHCRWPGCGRPWSWCDAHHIDSWAGIDGPTDLDNLLLVCRHHHTLAHDGGWALTGTAADPVFTRPDGSAHPQAPP